MARLDCIARTLVPSTPFGALTFLSLIGIASGACDRAAHVEPSPAAERRAIVEPATTLATEITQHIADGDSILDVRGDGAVLAGRAIESLPNSDAPRSLRVRWLARGGIAERFALADASLQEARFVPGTSGAVVLTTGGELIWLATPGSAPVRLDTEAAGPLSVAAEGRYVAYTRGEMPDYEVFRLDVESLRVEALTTDMAPVWCPALSSNGREVVFVSGRGGTPGLYRLDTAGGSAQRIADAANSSERASLPEGPGAPLWVGDTLLFSDGDSVRRIGLDGTDGGVLPGVRSLQPVTGTNSLLARTSGAGDPLRIVVPSALGGER